MTGKPAARLGDSTKCPQRGHSPSAIVSGSPDVLINGLPAARLGDTTSCGSVLIGKASTTVFINGQPAMILGGEGTHGDVVIGGSGDVIIGDQVGGSDVTSNVGSQGSRWIGFRLDSAENYEGMSCKVHLDDGSVLTGRFDANNGVMFSGVSGSRCERLEFELPDVEAAGSVTDSFLSMITGEPQA